MTFSSRHGVPGTQCPLAEIMREVLTPAQNLRASKQGRSQCCDSGTPSRMAGMCVAAVQHQGFHFEVLAAVLYTFVQLKSNVTAYTGSPALDMQNIITTWYPVQFRQYDAFETVSCVFDVVVLVTFPEGHETLAEQIGSKACASDQQFMVIVHNPGNLRSPGEDYFATAKSHASQL